MNRTESLNGALERGQQFAGRQEGCFFQIESWMPSEIKAISPLMDRLMRLIKGSHCVDGEEPEVELALGEALDNAVVHGNRTDRQKLVQVLCRCQLGKGICVVVKDQEQGFDPSAVPDPTAPENLGAEHGRGIWLMKSVMDEVSFERGGAEVHMRKAVRCEPSTVSGNSVDTTAHGVFGTRPNAPGGGGK